MNDDIREWEMDFSKVNPTRRLLTPTGGPEDAMIAVRNVFASLGDIQAEAKEYTNTGNILILDENTDCMACGLAGQTADRVKGAGKCIAFNQCGATVNEAFDKAHAIASASADPADANIVPRMKDVLSNTPINAEDMLKGFEKLTQALGIDPATGDKVADMDLQPDGAFHPDVLPNVYSVWRKIAVYCSYKDPAGKSNDLLRDCTDYTSVKKAIKGMLGDMSGMRAMAVYPDAIDELFVEYVDPSYMEAQAPPYLSSCPGYSSFNLVVTSVQQHVNKRLVEVLNNIDDNQDLITQLNNEGKSNDEIQICGLKSWVVDMGTQKPADVLNNFKPPDHDIAPGMLVAKPGQATPATTIHPGDDTDIHIYNFPKGSTVSIQLLSSKIDPAAVGPEPILMVKDFDDKQPTTLKWQVPSDLATDKYYFRATALGLTSYSQLMEVAPHGSRRRLHVI